VINGGSSIDVPLITSLDGEAGKRTIAGTGSGTLR
jgi:hypothetical protein